MKSVKVRWLATPLIIGAGVARLDSRIKGVFDVSRSVGQG